jgi:hypothetical protein
VGLKMPEGREGRMGRMRAVKYEFKIGGLERWGCPHVKVEYVVSCCKRCGQKFFICPVCVINNSRLGTLCPACDKKDNNENS